MFPWIFLYHVSKATQRIGDSRLCWDPPQGLWQELAVGSMSSWIRASSSVSSRVTLCINLSGRLAPSLISSSLTVKAHTIQITKQLGSILHFHESIISEFVLNMLMLILQVSYPYFADGLGWVYVNWMRLELTAAATFKAWGGTLGTLYS